MNPHVRYSRVRRLAAALSIVAIAGGDAFAAVLLPQEASRIPADQLDSLVAPIALYPDPLLAQTLAASTYPLELMQLQQFLARNAGLKDKALAESVAKQPWDPSIQAMAALPDVVKRLTDDIQWTTDLGNAFLAQQSDVMDAVQRMRQKAQGTGNLETTAQQVVETRVVEEKQVIVIEQASPETIYVPSYNPTVVYGAPVYPYPPIYYPPVGAYAAGMAVSFGVGVAMGAFWGSGGWGGWGYRPGWGHNNININNNNNFIRNTNINGARNGTINRTGNTWQHNAAHRGGAPYRDSATANRFGGTARGESLSNRQAGARQQINRQGGNLSSNARTGGRTAGAVGTSGSFDRSSLGQQRQGGAAANRASGANLSNRAGGSGAAGSRDFSRAGTGGGADRIGQRDLSRSGASQNAFSGGSGASARANSARGSSSLQSRSGSSTPSRSASSSGSFGGGSRSGGGNRSFSGGGGSRSFGGGGGGSRGGGGHRGGGGRR